jgi:hypothetical protein
MTTTAIASSFLTPESRGDTYGRTCAAVGLEATETGWGLLHCLRDGRRITLITAGGPHLEALIAGDGARALKGLEVPEGTFTLFREGWPEEWDDKVSPFE